MSATPPLWTSGRSPATGRCSPPALRRRPAGVRRAGARARRHRRRRRRTARRRLVVDLRAPLRGVAPGQTMVLYRPDHFTSAIPPMPTSAALTAVLPVASPPASRPVWPPLSAGFGSVRTSAPLPRGALARRQPPRLPVLPRCVAWPHGPDVAAVPPRSRRRRSPRQRDDHTLRSAGDLGQDVRHHDVGHRIGKRARTSPPPAPLLHAVVAPAAVAGRVCTDPASPPLADEHRPQRRRGAAVDEATKPSNALRAVAGSRYAAAPSEIRPPSGGF